MVSQKKELLSSTRQVPHSWNTMNGIYQTKRRCEMDITFFEYSNSKRYSVTPDIVEYDEMVMPEPAFDLILGTKTMNEELIIVFT